MAVAKHMILMAIILDAMRRRMRGVFLRRFQRDIDGMLEGKGCTFMRNNLLNLLNEYITILFLCYYIMFWFYFVYILTYIFIFFRYVKKTIFWINFINRAKKYSHCTKSIKNCLAMTWCFLVYKLLLQIYTEKLLICTESNFL